MTSPGPDIRKVVLVDARDNELGEDTVHGSHQGAGRKHRAFTALVLDHAGRVIVARRAAEKPLWPGYWDATVASHPRPGESYEAAGERRLAEELGVACALSTCGRFEYEVPYGDVGSENEVCATLVGRLAEDAVLRPTPSEISEVRALEPRALVADSLARPEAYCPWLFLAFLSLHAHRATLPAELGEPWSPLELPEGDERLCDALQRHFPSARWTMLEEDGA